MELAHPDHVLSGGRVGNPDTRGGETLGTKCKQLKPFDQLELTVASRSHRESD